MEWYVYTIALLLLIIILLLCCCFSKIIDTVKNIIKEATKAISKLWYFVILVPSTIYVIVNFDNLKRFTFFSEFNGDNLIFILWLLLLLLPMFDKMEIMGVSIQRSKDTTEEKVKEVAAEATTDIAKVEELRQLLNKEENKNGK